MRQTLTTDLCKIDPRGTAYRYRNFAQKSKIHICLTLQASVILAETREGQGFHRQPGPKEMNTSQPPLQTLPKSSITSVSAKTAHHKSGNTFPVVISANGSGSSIFQLRTAATGNMIPIDGKGSACKPFAVH